MSIRDHMDLNIHGPHKVELKHTNGINRNHMQCHLNSIIGPGKAVLWDPTNTTLTEIKLGYKLVLYLKISRHQLEI
jgi:hypothetical protein